MLYFSTFLIICLNTPLYCAPCALVYRLQMRGVAKYYIVDVCIMLKKVKGGVAFYRKPISELRSVACRMGSDSITCRLIQVNAPRLVAGHSLWVTLEAITLLR